MSYLGAPRTASSSAVKIAIVVAAVAAACKHIKLNYCHWAAASLHLASLPLLACPCRCRYCPRLAAALSPGL